MYIELPETVKHDAENQFMAEVCLSNENLIKFETNAVLIEVPSSVSFAESYHTPVGSAFLIIKFDADDLSDKEALQMSEWSVNYSVGPNGLIPSLLVYGAIPRLGVSDEQPSAKTYNRATTLQEATEEM